MRWRVNRIARCQMAGVTSKASSPAVRRPRAKYMTAWIKNALQWADSRRPRRLPCRRYNSLNRNGFVGSRNVVTPWKTAEFRPSEGVPGRFRGEFQVAEIDSEPRADPRNDRHDINALAGE